MQFRKIMPVIKSAFVTKYVGFIERFFNIRWGKTLYIYCLFYPTIFIEIRAASNGEIIIMFSKMGKGKASFEEKNDTLTEKQQNNEKSMHILLFISNITIYHKLVISALTQTHPWDYRKEAEPTKHWSPEVSNISGP